MSLEKKPLQLSPTFKYALDCIEKTNASMFITGKAGTGKSTLLQLFRNTTQKNCVVLAPTGVAALNVKGQTIHSFFGFPPKILNKSDIKKRRYRKLYEKMEVLVIDEISMVRADILDNIDYFLQINRNNPLPFGGVQMVFFGDMFQLPPVVAKQEEKMILNSLYDSPYFFSAHIMQHFDIEMLELNKVYRQDERHFIRLLDSVRLNQIDYDDLLDLNERHVPNFKDNNQYITLSTRNQIVNSINNKKLNEIHTEEFIYTAKTTGEFDPRLYPTEFLLKLRIGTQVMFIRNDAQKRFVNGTIGKVVYLDMDEIRVEIEQNDKKQIIEVQAETWEILKYSINPDNNEIETEVKGTFEQFPLKLAWAITIHKSQGKTFDKVIIDMGRGAFEHGQTYVALSRCRTLNGIVLKQALRFQDIMVDERIIQFYESHF